MGDRINPDDSITVITAPQPQTPIPSRTRVNRVSDFLQDSCRINTLKQHYEKYRRYVFLKKQEIYTSLVNSFTVIFSSRQRDFRGLQEAFPAPTGVSFQVYAARAYISMWFYDLYVSNREAARALSPIAFNQYFDHEETFRSQHYDDFLCLLHASLHPTHIKGLPEDVLYIPIISETTDWTSDNPFGITNFVNNLDLAYGIIMRMRDSRAWHISSLVSTTTGRPAWLFDWHDNDSCLAWFPLEGNYTMEDVALAYILGEACTPNLACRDVDDWQDFPANIMPQNFSVASANRVVPRRFFGTYEVRNYEVIERTIDLNNFVSPSTIQAQKKRKTIQASGSGSTTPVIPSGPEPQIATSTDGEPALPVITINQFRIIDWTYYARLIAFSETHTRIGALKIISLVN